MPRIRFTATPKLPRDLAHLGYQQGDEVDLSDDQADRWVRRAVAEIIPDAPPVRRAAPVVVPALAIAPKVDAPKLPTVAAPPPAAEIPKSTASA